MATPADYEQAVTAYRHEKDEFFRSEDSPIPEEEIPTFAGLRYFPPSVDWQIEARVEILPSQAPVELGTSDGDVRPFERFARLHFTVDGQEGALTAYRMVHMHSHGDEDEHAGHVHEHDPWFIPFRDAQAGQETYGAGRYLDIEPAEGEDDVILDFNLAYNPYCAYNENYSCPLPPVENSLPFAIKAGEKVYHEA